MALLQKPIVVDKFREFHKYVKANNNQIGTKQRGLDININTRYYKKKRRAGNLEQKNF